MNDRLTKSLHQLKNLNSAKTLSEPQRNHTWLQATPWTEEQHHIFKSSENQFAICALAGTGKTSTLIEYAHRHPAKSKWRYFTYNRHLKKEAQKYQHIVAETWHGYAYQHHGHQLLSGFLSPEDLPYTQANERNFYFSALETYAQTPQEDFDLGHKWITLAQEHGIFLRDSKECEAQLKKLWRQILSKQMKPSSSICLKLLWLSDHHIQGRLLIDECQDLPAITWALIQKQKTPLIIAGDPYQNLYSWQDTVVDWQHYFPTQHWLTQTHRFTQPIADQANFYLRHLGSQNLLQSNPHATSYGGPEVILTRTQLEKSRQYLSFLRQGKMVNIDRRNNPLYQIVSHYEKQPMMDVQDFEQWMSEQASPSWQEAHALYETLTPTEKKALLNQTPSETDLHIMTTHESKGLQFSKATLSNDFKPHDSDSLEQRLLYVAHTRASQLNSPYTALTQEDGF